MIGEATLSHEQTDGQKQTVLVPTGQATQKDPATGRILLTPATVADAVNAVVRAIASAAPDATGRLPTDEGCSEGLKPLRDVASPPHDDTSATAISDQLSELSEGDLLLVVAVLLNNKGHLCIDSSAVAGAIAVISTVRPEVVAQVVDVATSIDPEHSKEFTDAVTPNNPGNAQEPRDPGNPNNPRNAQEPRVVVNPNSEVPPGGPDPSPE